MSWRKGSNASIETSGGSNGSRSGATSKGNYPFALTLRIRVVQIVCGIAAIVMGSVAAIEERHNFNLSLGVPAGAVTVIAAAWSIHRSLHRSAKGQQIGLWIARILWAISSVLHFGLLVLAIRTAFKKHAHNNNSISSTAMSLAVVQGILAFSVLIVSGFAAKLLWEYGQPPVGPIPRLDRCPRSTSHTAVSMVPLTSNYGCHATSNDNSDSKNQDQANSDSEVMEIVITGTNAPEITTDEVQAKSTSNANLLDNDYSERIKDKVKKNPDNISMKHEVKYMENGCGENSNLTDKLIT